MSRPPAGRELLVVLPGDVADPAAPSGGNVYGLRACRELAQRHGWRVRRADLPGAWPRPDAAARERLGAALASAPDGALVLLDGLVGCGVPDVVLPHAPRLRLAVLLHLPLADETGLPPAEAQRLAAAEQATLRAADAVVVTGPGLARRLVGAGLDPQRVHVATPGVDPAGLATGTDGASGLLCVGSLTPRKGQDRLVAALAALADRRWSLVCAGALRDPGYVAALRDQLADNGLQDRVRLAGPLPPQQLEQAYAGADLVVLVSWTETYGMAVTEALARGIPVLAGSAGALPDTLGRAGDGSRPGLLVPPGDAPALTSALRRWFDDAALRERLRAAAGDRRNRLAGWADTGRALDAVLERLRAAP